jgi:hypothetical protein
LAQSIFKGLYDPASKAKAISRSAVAAGTARVGDHFSPISEKPRPRWLL